MARFSNRREAGDLLGKALEKYRGEATVVYALPRGGVELGVKIAQHLEAPLDLVIPRKVGHPSYEEYAICAVTEDGQAVCNEAEIQELDEQWLQMAIQKELAEAKRRRAAYLDGRPTIPVKGKLAIITDDGIATGLTMLAAIQDVKARGPSRIILAVPVMPSDIVPILRQQVDEIIALLIPEFYLGSVSAYYDEFEQVQDNEVINLLRTVQPVKPGL